MKHKFFLLITFCLAVHTAKSQSEPAKTYRNFPLVVSFQFHNLSMPFRDVKSNFKNIGIGIGTEVSLNGKHNWAQQFTLGWYRNKHVGNGFMAYTQPAWRPTISKNVFTELKLGVGYLHASRPVESFKQENGKWVSVGYRGKGSLIIPAGISIGYQKYSTTTYIAPFISYQLMLVKDYSKSIPIVPETLIQIGSRIHFQ